MDEWQIDEHGRRFRMVGKVKEYEMTYRIGGVEVPASQLKEFNRRNKEAAAAQRAAENAEQITERCPFASGASTTCKSDCALRTAHGCALVYQIDPKLRMPLENVHYPTNENIGHYSKLINDVTEGGADIISTSPGWTGHAAFIDPVPEFMSDDIEEWLNMEARLVTLHPLTVAQNSLHGVFGQSGYVTSVPPRAATIGPVDVKRAKERIEVHALLTNNTFSSWQRMTSRLVTHGPVTPLVPSSPGVHQRGSRRALRVLGKGWLLTEVSHPQIGRID